MTQIVLASGPSNMMGRGPGGDWNMLTSLKVWNNRNELDGLTDLGSSFIPTKRGAVPFHGQDNCLGVQAANFIAQQTSEQVRLVLTGHGGYGISHWHDGTTRGPQLLRMSAILARARVIHADYFLWLGGGQGITVEGFMGMVTALRTDRVIGNFTPIVIGTVSPQYVDENATVREIAAGDPAIRLAELDGIPTLEDDIHVTGPGCVTSGLIYAGLALQGNGT